MRDVVSQVHICVGGGGGGCGVRRLLPDGVAYVELAPAVDPLSVCVAAVEVVEEGRMLYVAREKVRRGRQAGTC